jgi:hypothetical protein
LLNAGVAMPLLKRMWPDLGTDLKHEVQLNKKGATLVSKTTISWSKQGALPWFQNNITHFSIQEMSFI